MTSKIKMYLSRKVADSFKTVKANPANLKSMLLVNNRTKDFNAIEMTLSLNDLQEQLGIPDTNNVLSMQPDDIITKIDYTADKRGRHAVFTINRDIFIKDLMENCNRPEINLDRRNIMVEYSSPNVAKPFHVGHLRSTIIGNFIANINNYKTNKVTKINYLGDWGTQFGFIKVGLDELNYSLEDIKENPLELLYESYVHANKLNESDSRINERAREEFNKLEKGCKEGLEDWSRILQFTITELQSVYQRLGVEFDRYEYESMYSAKHISTVLEQLKNAKLLVRHEDGKVIAKINDRQVTLIKSDGSTLYLTRDIAAAIDRHNRFNFDQMLYIVDNSQTDHFIALKSLLQRMGHKWANQLTHVKFGRVRGMSTRKGQVVFLKDILDEIGELMQQKQVDSPTTKARISDTAVTDTLGVSCVIINDLKQRRQRDYEFSWANALDVKGDSGIKLQYTHARLCSLEENSGVYAASTCIPQLLTEPEVSALIKEMGRFTEVIETAAVQLEACVLVNYLFHLCNHINKAMKVLNVKHEQDPIKGSQRSLLFKNARYILSQGMQILGLKPLTKM